MTTKLLKKIYISTASLFIIITVLSINILSKESAVSPVVKLNKLETNKSIYLINDKGYLVKYNVYINSNNKLERIKKILNLLIDNKISRFPKGLSGIIPKGTKILDVFVGKNIVTINFSKELMNVELKKEKQLIQSLVYSICDSDINELNILVEGKKISHYPKSREKLPKNLNKDIGINEIYNLSNINNIENVTIYYMDKINQNYYYVPVTKYINDNREKIKIIIEELSTNYINEKNLISFLNYNTKLLNYTEDANVLTLNFNEYLLDDKDTMDKIYNLIGYSVFANYDVDMIMFQIKGNNLKAITRV